MRSLPHDMGVPMYEVVWPLGISVLLRIDNAPALLDSNGKTVCELSDFRFKGDQMYSILNEVLRRRFPFRISRLNCSRPWPASTWSAFPIKGWCRAYRSHYRRSADDLRQCDFTGATGKVGKIARPCGDQCRAFESVARFAYAGAAGAARISGGDDQRCVRTCKIALDAHQQSESGACKNPGAARRARVLL